MSKCSPLGGRTRTFFTNESILSFIKWCGQFFFAGVGLEGFIILTETVKPVLVRANTWLRMGAAVMFVQSLLIPVSLWPTPFHTENRMNGGKLCFWLTRKAAYRGAGSVDGHLLQAVRNREGRCRVGGGRCTLNQARQVLGECVWCYNLLIKGLSHVVAWKLEHIA